MKSLSALDKKFINEVKKVFEVPEVLIVSRYVYGDGNRDFIILDDMAEFDKLIKKLRNKDSVIEMKSFDKIREGTIDQRFIDRILPIYSEGATWIILGPDNFEHTSNWAYAESKDELNEELKNRLGNHVCIVREPEYISDSSSIEAYVPDEDGIVRPGAY